MPKIKPDRNDRQGGLGVGGPQDGTIHEGSDDRQQQGEESQRQAGLGGGDQGEGGQRHPGGGSRGDERQQG